MSRTDRDKAGGHTSSQYQCSHDGVAEFKRACRREIRRAAKQDLKAGKEPPPQHPAQHYYFD